MSSVIIAAVPLATKSVRTYTHHTATHPNMPLTRHCALVIIITIIAQQAVYLSLLIIVAKESGESKQQAMYYVMLGTVSETINVTLYYY
jgi:hypothetical protein